MELTIAPAWRKSSHSGNGVNCVETGNGPSAVLVRDTQQYGEGPVLAVSPDVWQRFTKSLLA